MRATATAADITFRNLKELDFDVLVVVTGCIVALREAYREIVEDDVKAKAAVA